MLKKQLGVVKLSLTVHTRVVRSIPAREKEFISFLHSSNKIKRGINSLETTIQRT